MTRVDSANRWIARAVAVLVFGMIGFLAVVGPANADPYPPVPPTELVPAAAPVPAPAVTNPGAESVIIAPGSYPVQARTGAGPVAETPDHSVLVTSSIAVLLAALLVTFFVFRRSRRWR